MTLPITIPNTFANATASIPLSQLDNNFSTVVVAVNGIGNGAESLSNVSITGGSVANVTLANVSISGETLDNVTLTNVSITSGNATFTTANVTTLDLTNIEVTNIKAKDGTASITLADSTGIATFSKATVVSTTDNTNAALRITQLGTGNALLVEDSTNPDPSPFVINSGGQTTVGYTSQPFFISGVVPLFGVVGTGNTTSVASVANYSADSNPAWLLLGKSRGSIGSQGIVSSGDSVGIIDFSGSDGVIQTPLARITAAVDGTPGTNDMPGRLVFSTTADGASNPTERMRIRSDGGVSIGGAGAAEYTLLLQKNVTGATTAWGMSNNGVVQSDVTSTAFYYRTSALTAAASFTLTNLNHFAANQSTLGAGSSVTNQFGFNVASTLTGATNNYGFYSNIASGSGRWNFYANGTADNFFAGNVGIGTTSPGSFFDGARNLVVGSGSGAQGMTIYAGTADSSNIFFADGTSTPAQYIGQIRYFHNNNFMMFVTNDGERMRIDSSGNLLVGITTARANAGDVQVSKGISFPATQSAQSDANTLDDYEEGTWTPSIGGTATYTVQSGQYTKIGRLVNLRCNIVVNVLGTGSTNQISGLPFTSAAISGGNPTASASVGYFDNLAVSPVYISAYVASSDTTLTISGLTAAAASANPSLGVFGNSARIDITVTYFT
jgi:hypothetical protein